MKLYFIGIFDSQCRTYAPYNSICGELYLVFLLPSRYSPLAFLRASIIISFSRLATASSRDRTGRVSDSVPVCKVGGR